MRRRNDVDWFERFILGAGIAWAVFCAAVIAGVIFVAVHFIAKAW